MLKCCSYTCCTQPFGRTLQLVCIFTGVPHVELRMGCVALHMYPTIQYILLYDGIGTMKFSCPFFVTHQCSSQKWKTYGKYGICMAVLWNKIVSLTVPRGVFLLEGCEVQSGDQKASPAPSGWTNRAMNQLINQITTPFLFHLRKLRRALPDGAPTEGRQLYGRSHPHALRPWSDSAGMTMLFPDKVTRTELHIRCVPRWTG